ncbi:MAG: hypothetical protein LBQ98_03320, partial [Nitrososphaerota archaeon]|nr:hypothetical protein [Nitrososphaerota archaeon]
PIATSTIVNHVTNFIKKAKSLNEIPLQLQKEAVLNFDETTSSVNGKNFGSIWLQVKKQPTLLLILSVGRRGQMIVGC